MNTDLIKIFAMGCKYYAEEIEQGYIIPTYLLKKITLTSLLLKIEEMLLSLMKVVFQKSLKKI